MAAAMDTQGQKIRHAHIGEQHINYNFLGGNNFLHEASKAPANQSFLFKDLVDKMAVGSLYNSIENIEPGKCHPGTRRAILRRLERITRTTQHESSAAQIAKPFTWLYGSAGSGKSAIMRSLCERLDEQDRLLASFFFFRASPTRNTANAFVTTLAVQFCQAVPALVPHLEQSIHHKPLIFSQSLEAQVRSLLVDPFIAAIDTVSIPCPRTIVIDGLDECQSEIQRTQVLNILNQLATSLPIPIKIVIASRPELDIRREFQSPTLRPRTDSISLNEESDADADIRKFFEDKFAHILATHPLAAYLQKVNNLWPASNVIDFLVDKASGQFIFAATVVRFVEAIRHDPDERLQIILGSLPQGSLTPYRELDALYLIIMGTVPEEHLQEVLYIVGIILAKFEPYPKGHAYQLCHYPSVIEICLHLRPGKCRRLLLGLESVLIVPSSDDQSVRIFHKSFSDFLFDESRSGKFYIAYNRLCERLVSSCIKTGFRFYDEVVKDAVTTFLPCWMTHALWSADLVDAVKTVNGSSYWQTVDPLPQVIDSYSEWDMFQLAQFAYRDTMCIWALNIFLSNLERLAHSHQVLRRLYDAVLPSFCAFVKLRLEMSLPDPLLWIQHYAFLIAFYEKNALFLGGFRCQLRAPRSSPISHFLVVRTPVNDAIAEALAGTSDIADARVWPRKALERFFQIFTPESYPSLADVLLRSNVLQYCLPCITYSETLAHLLTARQSLIKNVESKDVVPGGFHDRQRGVEEMIDEYVKRAPKETEDVPITIEPVKAPAGDERTDSSSVAPPLLTSVPTPVPASANVLTTLDTSNRDSPESSAAVMGETDPGADDSSVGPGSLAPVPNSNPAHFSDFKSPPAHTDKGKSRLPSHILIKRVWTELQQRITARRT